jgi:hypothetical protein
MNPLNQMMVKIQKHFVILWAIIGLSSCLSIPSVNIDPNKNNKYFFNKDLAECQEDYPESSSGLHYSQWKSCMGLKGWR